MKDKNPEYPSLCGHRGDKVVQFSAVSGGKLHTICTPCFNKEIYFVQEVEESGTLFTGGRTIEIRL